MDDRQDIRLGELLAELSYALDLAEGQAAGHALRACLIGMTLASAPGSGAKERSELYYAHLLKDAGCSSNASRIAALLEADDQTVKRALKLTDWTRFHDRLRYASRVVAPERADRRAAEAAGHARAAARHAERASRGCAASAGAEIAAGLGFPPGTSDGDPLPGRALGRQGATRTGLRGEGIPRAARIMCLAQTVDVFMTAHGIQGALEVARERRGTWFEPALVDLLDAEVLHALPIAHDELEAAVTAHEPRRARARRRRRARGPRGGRVRGADRREVAVDRRALAPRGRARRRAPPRSWGSPRAATSSARRCCTTSASSRSPAGCSTSRGASRSRSGPRCARTRCTPSGCSAASRRCGRSPRSPPRTTSASTAAATRTG